MKYVSLKKKSGGFLPPTLGLFSQLSADYVGTDAVEIVHAEDAVVLVGAVVACNCHIRGVDEWIDCHAVASLEANLRLEGGIIDCTDHL